MWTFWMFSVLFLVVVVVVQLQFLFCTSLQGYALEAVIISTTMSKRCLGGYTVFMEPKRDI